MWGSDDDRLQAISDEEATKPQTRAQIAWDERSYAVTKIAAELRKLTVLGTDWARNPERLAAVDALLDDACREVRQLVIEGSREGDPVKPIPKLSKIEARPVVCRMKGEDAA